MYTYGICSRNSQLQSCTLSISIETAAAPSPPPPPPPPPPTTTPAAADNTNYYRCLVSSA